MGRGVVMGTAIAAIALALFARAAAGALPVSAKLSGCRPSLEPTARAAVFKGDMRRLRGGDRMEMRFDLLVKLEGRPWTRVVSEGLGVWNRADPGVARYRYTKRVENLASPAVYRAVVSFRWLDQATGAVRRTARRRAPVCRQPDLRPDLVVLGVQATPAEGQRATYAVALRNAGRTTAGASAGLLVIDGAAQPLARLEPLAAGEMRVLRFTGPACRTTVEARLDAEGAIDEADEDNNRLVAPCPL